MPGALDELLDAWAKAAVGNVHADDSARRSKDALWVVEHAPLATRLELLLALDDLATVAPHDLTTQRT
ncbi:MAG: hypothetical protein AAF721_22775, partial [Myxococcota bacterium]